MQIISLTTSILNSILVARFLSIDQYGSYSLILKSTNIATIVFSFGIASSIQNNPSFLISHRKSLFKFLIVTIVVQSISIFLYSNSTLHSRLLAICAVLLGITNLLLLMISNYEIAVEETKKLFYTRTFTPLVLTFCLFFAAILNLDALSKLINVVVLIVSLNLIMIFWKFISFNPASMQHQELQKDEITEYFMFGLQTFPALAIRSFHLTLDLLLLGFILSPLKLSEYAICITIGSLSSLPIFIYATDKQVLFKKITLSEGRSLITSRVFRQFLPISICWSTLLFVIVYLNNGDFFFSISTNALLILAILMFANIVDGVVLIFSLLAISNGQHRLNTRIQINGFLINIVMMIVLVPNFLGMGAAVASLISYTFCLFQSYKKIQ